MKRQIIVRDPKFIRTFASSQITLMKTIEEILTLNDLLDVCRNTNIESLLLRNNFVTNTHVENLVEAMRKTQTSRLTFIDFDSSFVSISSMNGLLDLTSKLNLGWNRCLHKEIGLFCDMLAAGRRITMLDLKFCHLDDSAICLLADAVARNPLIVELDIRQNPFGDEGTIAIAKVLAANRLRSCGATGRNTTAIGAAAICRALEQQTTLTLLTMSGIIKVFFLDVVLCCECC